MVRVLFNTSMGTWISIFRTHAKKKKKAKARAREMSQPLRVVVALAEDLDSVCSTHNRL